MSEGHETQHYFGEMMEKAQKAPRGRLSQMEVLHDSWCDRLHGKGPCNCEPLITEPKPIHMPEDN